MNQSSDEIFVGFCLSSHFAHKIEHLNDFFLDDSYLQALTLNGKSYLGKFVGDCVQFDSLELMQVHICSILKKIAPEASYELETLSIFLFPKPA